MNPKSLQERAQKALDYVAKRGGAIQLDDAENGLLKAMAKGYPSFMTEAGETMLDDIELTHAIHGRGLDRIIHANSKGSKAADIKGVKVHYGAKGEVYELAPHARIADVVKPAETPPVSLDRWLSAALLGDRCEDKAALQFAAEKAVSTGSTGILLPIEYQGEWGDAVRAQMVLNACGMQTVTMNAGQLAASRLVSDPTVSWRAEAGAVSASDPVFELQSLVAKSLAVRTVGSVELVQDSPDWGSQLMAVMTKAMAVEVDRVGLMGTGSSNQPRGIFNTSGINSVAGATYWPSFNAMIRGIQKLLEANCALEDVDKNAVMSPRSWGTLASLQTSDGQSMKRPSELENMAFRPTTGIPNTLGVGTESAMILGDFSKLVLGVRLEASVEALRLASYASNLQLEFLAYTRVDFLVRRPASFVVVTGIPN